MAGYALQVRTGKPFATYIKEEVFRPLGMNASTFDWRDAWRSPSVAKGHPNSSGEGMLPYIPMIPSGAMYTNVNDVARCIVMHLNGGKVNGEQFISEKLLKEMYAPQFAVPGQKAGYGLGTDMQLWYGVNSYNHGGGGFGYNTIMKWIPAYRIGIVILSNATNNDVYWLADRALELQQELKTGVAPTKPVSESSGPPATVDSAILRNLEGTYKEREGLAHFEVKDGNLYAGEEKPEKLRPLNADEFLLDSANGRTWTFRFTLDAAGHPTGVLVLGDVHSEYMPINDQPNEKPGPNRAEWRAWTGEYSTTVK